MYPRRGSDIYSRKTPHQLTHSSSERVQRHVGEDVENLSDNYDATAPSVGLDMAGHDQHLLGPKVVILDAFVVDLLNVDTSAQTFRLKLMLNMDWEDDGTIEPEVKAKRNLGRPTSFAPSVASGLYSTQGSLDETSSIVSERESNMSNGSLWKQNNSSRSMGKIPSKMMRKTSREEVYKTGKYVLKQMYQEDPLGTTWNPEVVLANAIADESPIEAGSKFHSVNMLANRPVISRQILYQPECRCEFTFSNFPFDETDLVVKFSSNKWNAEQVDFLWSNRLSHSNTSSQKNMRQSFALRRESSILKRGVDANAIGGIGLSEFEITKVRVENVEKDMNSMQRYDSVEGAFSEAHLIIRVRRDPYSYLLRVAVVAELLMLLEFLSFLTDKDDLSARFSISGTIFLAMVSLYGPMADALPKVSVVTRVDKW